MDGTTSDENSDCAPDDAFSMICGDLGLGENSRSSASIRYELEVLSNSEPEAFMKERKLYKQLSLSSATSSKGHVEETEQCDKKNQPSTHEDHICDKSGSSTPKSRTFMKKKSKSRKSDDDNHCACSGNEECCNFPTYADVPYGTSLRQQKILYEQNLGSIIRKNTFSNSDGDDTPTNETALTTLTSEEIDKRLLSALEEVEELKLDLDVCKQRLDAKYTAITILKKQAEENNHEHVANELKAKETSLQLAQEVNKLQFELQWRESSFQDSQQTWAQRFDRDSGGLRSRSALLGDGSSLVEDCGLMLGETPRETLHRKHLRVCRENALLTAQLDARSEELRRANMQKIAMRRERDELLALLDVKERSRYERSHCSQASDDEFANYTTVELAVLGACRCRGPDGTEPCACAYAATNLSREVYRLREESRMMRQRRDEAYKTVDAYRMAFEEQLLKTRTLTHQLAAMATMSSRSVKTKAAAKWLLSVLADDDYPQVKGTDKDASGSDDLENLTLPELVTLLTDMLQEKREALVHQKLAGQVLAARLKETETRLTSLTEADGDVFHS